MHTRAVGSPTATQAATQIRVCGHLVVQLDGERLEGALSGRQGRLLFAYLVLNRNRPVRRDELVAALWSEDGQPPSGDALLAPPLSRLRKALGPGRVEGRGELSLVLPSDAWIDWEVALASLERVRAALVANDYDGVREPALAAVAIADRGLLPGLEAAWIDERRRELGDVRVEALEALAAVGVALGGAELPGAEQAARAAVEAAPFRESARLALMEALRARGNVAEALRVFEDLRVLLREELGTMPGPRVAMLHEQLLRADAEPAAGLATGAPRSAPVAPAPAGSLVRGTTAAVAALRAGGDIVERDSELATLSAMAREAEDGLGRVAVIEGPAGIGKTRLLSELRRHAASGGALVLAARGSVLEREFSFGVARQLFEGVLTDPAERDRLLSGAAAPARAVLAMPDDPETAGAAGDASFAALHGLFWLTLNVASERPLVLALDDLQWADRPSLRFVAYLVRRLEGTPILIAATVRSGEPATDQTLLDEIGSDPMAVPIRPGPLSPAAVAGLVRTRLGPTAEDGFSAACHRATGGNPLLVRQLLSALEADHVTPEAANAQVVRDVGPRAVGRSVLLRLARLPGDAVAVARAVAVLGESAELPAIAALSDLEEARVATATGALARAEILRFEAPIGFAHPLIQDAVYRELPPGERELQHARAARVLASLGASPEQISAHLLQIPRRADPWAAATLREAGLAAMRRGSAESAVGYLRRALDEPPAPADRPPLLLDLGLAEGLERADAAIEHLRAAYRELDDPLARGVAAEVCGRIMLLSQPAEDVLELMEDASAQLGNAADPALVDVARGIKAVELISRHFGAGDAEALDALDEYRDAGRVAGGPGARKLVVLAAYVWARTDGHVDTCADLSAAALNNDVIEDDVFAAVALYPLIAGDRPEAEAGFDAWLAEKHRRGSLLGSASAGLWRGEWLTRRGELIEAEETLAPSFDQLDDWGHQTAKLWSAAFLARALTERGKLDEAEAALARGGRVLPQGDGPMFWLEGRAKFLLAAGRTEEALAVAEDIESRPDRIDNPAFMPWRSLKAIALDRLGRTDEALELARDELRAAERWGAPSTIGMALRVLGTLEREDGIERLERAVEVLERSPARLELAKALAALGGTLRRARRPSDAREPLRRALELADVCGATPLAEHARAELYASGARPRTEALSGVAALTASERRVVDLAAGGQTNRDIAQALFVTPKTVEVHLSNAYRKLGIRSRRDLGSALAEA
ncbi:MAG: hypothetical protein QOJ07_2564 [Thermoleophilaceae bacterium]|nr:hypothetical protein [Thermoleophilaceae bacterium]